MGKLIVDFKDNGLVAADAKVEEMAAALLYEWKTNDKNEMYITVASELLYSMFRVFVREKKIKLDDIEFRCNGNKIECNEKGRLKSWPKELCVFERVMERLM